MKRLLNKTYKFSKLLRTYRKQQNLTQETLAKLSGLSTSYIFLLEQGVRRPSRETILSISQALQLRENQIDELLRSIGEELPVKGDEVRERRILALIKDVLKDKSDFMKNLLYNRIENFIYQQAIWEPLEERVWDPEIVCGFSGFQDTALSYFVAESLRIKCELISWSEIPNKLQNNEITFAIHNPSALLSPEGNNLVFCLPPLFTFRGHAIFLRKGLENIASQKELPNFKISVAKETDLEVAVFKAFKDSGMKIENIEFIYQDSETGFQSIIQGEVDAFCGGLNHALALQELGFPALFKLGDIKLEPVDGIVTTKEHFEKHREVLKLFALLWFRNINLIKRNLENKEFMDRIIREINFSTRGRINQRKFQRVIKEYETFYLTPEEWKNKENKLRIYLKDLSDFFEMKGIKNSHIEKRLDMNNKNFYPQLL